MTTTDVYIGFDNGTTSAGIGVITNTGEATLYKLPIKKTRSYTQKEKHITRINHPALVELLAEIKAKYPGANFLACLERPMINSTRFTASMSAIRTLESTLIALESVGVEYMYIDSKEWQRVLLPNGTKGAEQLKKASLELGTKMFPKLKIKKDADGLLIAEYMRLKNARKL